MKIDDFGYCSQCTELVFLNCTKNLLVKQEVNCSTKQITITTAGGTELLMTFLQFNNCISKLNTIKTFLIHFRAIFTKCKHASNRHPYRERRLGLATESYTTNSAFKRCNREFDLNYGLMKSQLSGKSWVAVFPVYIVGFFQRERCFMFKFCWSISRSFPINIPTEHVFADVFLFYHYFTNEPTKTGGGGIQGITPFALNTFPSVCSWIY